MQAHALGSRRTKCTSSASATGYPIALPVTSQAKEEGGWASFFQGRRICGPESVRISEDSLRGTAGRSVEYFCRARLLAVEATPLATFLPPRPSHPRYHGCLAVKLRTFVAHFVVRARIGVLCVRLVDGDPSVAACTTVARFIAEMEPKMSGTR